MHLHHIYIKLTLQGIFTILDRLGFNNKIVWIKQILRAFLIFLRGNIHVGKTHTPLLCNG